MNETMRENRELDAFLKDNGSQTTHHGKLCLPTTHSSKNKTYIMGF